MPIGELFNLARLTISAFADEKGTPAGVPLVVQFNPETLSLRHDSAFQSAARSNKVSYLHPRAKTLNVALVFDGSGVSAMGVEVIAGRPSVAFRVQQFLETCAGEAAAASSKAHLRLTWGQGVLGKGFVCRLQSVDIRYTSFDRDGSPLRAELAATFVEYAGTAGLAAASAADQVQSRVVASGDTLPMLCLAVYGSAAAYLAVAAANGLDDFRALEPGRSLIFPPLDPSAVRR